MLYSDFLIMSRAIVARWRDWSGHGIEHLVLRTELNRIVAEGVVLAAAEERPFAATNRIECDAEWRVTRTKSAVSDS
jgi:hypothetical protein